MSYQLSVDIGGTFTDLYLRGSDGETNSFKSPTTPEDLTLGVFNTFEKAATEYGLTTNQLLANTSRFIHGTTIATNAIIEGTASKTALVTTEGFPDTLVLREESKDDPYEWDLDYPEPYIPRELTFEVEERINAEGGIETPLDEDDVKRVIEELKDSDVEAVAVVFFWSHVNPEHEQRVASLLEEAAPDIHYSLGHEVNPVIREYRRTVSTAIDASLYGPINDYLSRLQDKLETHDYDQSPLIIAANGGVMQLDEVARRPIWSVDSGPTMLPVAAREYTETELGRDNIIAVDMGGTSLDMGVVTNGEIPRTREGKVGDDILGVEKVEIESIGAGGGSIAWIDKGGLLHVGPKSAGADPGPACYGRGGTRPTVTDAALALGYLNEDYFLGGEMTIDRDAAENALTEHVGDQLGMGTVKTAHSIYATMVQQMVSGITEVTIERGIDPRRYVLSGGGGALGMFAVPIARELKMTDIVLPKRAGVASAVGGQLSDIRRDFSGSYFTKSSRFDLEEVNNLLETLESRADEFFERTNTPAERQSKNFYVEARYPFQVWELQVDLPSSRLDETDLQTLVDRFNTAHDNRYGFKQEDRDVEFVYWRVEAVGERDTPIEQADSQAAGELSYEERDAYFDNTRMTAKNYRGHDLAPGHNIHGPAFVDGDNTTLVLPPESELTITDHGNYHITL